VRGHMGFRVSVGRKQIVIRGQDERCWTCSPKGRKHHCDWHNQADRNDTPPPTIKQAAHVSPQSWADYNARLSAAWLPPGCRCNYWNRIGNRVRPDTMKCGLWNTAINNLDSPIVNRQSQIVNVSSGPAPFTGTLGSLYGKKSDAPPPERPDCVWAVAVDQVRLCRRERISSRCPTFHVALQSACRRGTCSASASPRGFRL